MSENWVRTSAVGDVAKEDVIKVTLVDRKIAVYRSTAGSVISTTDPRSTLHACAIG